MLSDKRELSNPIWSVWPFAYDIQCLLKTWSCFEGLLGNARLDDYKTQRQRRRAGMQWLQTWGFEA